MVTDVLAKKQAVKGPVVMSMSSAEVDDSRGPISHLGLMTRRCWSGVKLSMSTSPLLLAETVKFRCDGCLDVVLGVLTEVIFVEVLKLDGLLDEVLLDVVVPSCRCWWLLEVCHCPRRCPRSLDQVDLEVHFHAECQRCWLPTVNFHEVDCSACLLVDVLLEVLEVLELLVPLEVDPEVEVLAAVLPAASP